MDQPELTTIHLVDEGSSIDAGRRLVAALIDRLPDNRAFTVHLSGPLGAGKTTFARGMLRGAGVEGPIRSPTFTLVETYETPAAEFVHIDLYRISSGAEAEGLGLREYDRPGVIWLVEWPERAAVAPVADIRVGLAHAASGRELCLAGRTKIGLEVMKAAGF